MNSSNTSAYRNRYSKQHHHVQQRSLFLPIMLCSRSAIKDVKFSAHRSLSDDPSSPRLGCTGQVKRNNKVIGYPPPPPHPHPHGAHHKLNFSTTATATKKVRPSPPPPRHDCYSNSTSFTYHKLRRFFSSRNLITSPITSSFIATTTTSTKVRSTGSGVGGGSGAGRRVVLQVDGGRSRSKIDSSNKISYSGSINIGSGDSGDLGILDLAELDPPLPVVKRVVQQPGTTDGDSEKENLWKRRFGGIASLQTLQVQSVHGNNMNLPAPARTV